MQDVAPSAGYLPRTWAKLEIDRLLAEDADEAPATRIVELSKAMYVMTPFTSLLVLENEEMYQQFKVDRGRKDHWAMYPCAGEDSGGLRARRELPADPNKPADQKPTEQQVLQTIQVRVAPHCLHWPNAANGPGGPVMTALQMYGGAYAVPEQPPGETHSDGSGIAMSGKI